MGLREYWEWWGNFDGVIGMKMLDGYKTYIVGAVIIGICVCAVFDIVDQDKAVWFVGMMVGCGYITARMGMKK